MDADSVSAGCSAESSRVRDSVEVNRGFFCDGLAWGLTWLACIDAELSESVQAPRVHVPIRVLRASGENPSASEGDETIDERSGTYHLRGRLGAEALAV